MDRREFIKGCAAVAAAGALSGCAGAAENKNLPTADGNAGKKRKCARSVIEIWVWGGPSQLETFDPKPKAPKDYNGGFGEIKTNVPGITISEFWPMMAKIADKYSIIRTMTHPYPGHETATYLMQTGRKPGGGKVYPAIGAVIAMYKRKEYKGDVPPYVILTVPKGRFSEVGFLSEEFSPLVTGGNPNAQRFIVDGIVPPGGLTKEEQKTRFDILGELDTFTMETPQGLVAMRDFESAGRDARRVIEGDGAKVFDLSLESDATRDRYGRTTFGQSCLTARRLVESGVPYITINAQGWDTHKRHFEIMKTKAAEMDKALSALIGDLSEKGLLDSTIVWWTGEFGRTPRVDWEAPWNGGRNHYAKCFTSLVAGGGFAGGKVVGVSDETASKVVSRPVTPQDMLGSIYELCGIDPDGQLDNPIGLKTTVLPPQSKLGRLREIYKENV